MSVLVLLLPIFKGIITKKQYEKNRTETFVGNLLGEKSFAIDTDFF